MAVNGYTNGYDLTPEQGRELLDARAQVYFGISGDEFVRKWNLGEFDDEDACPEVIRVAMLIPLVR
jgi:hypothetical protein